jgi:peptide/nickel transport system ATP-binding protein
MTNLVEASDLRVMIGRHSAVDRVNFSIGEGERLGLIGESGSGKTLTALAIMGLLPDGVRVEGTVKYKGLDLVTLSEDELCQLRGNRISMVFQEPMTALNPVMKVGAQIAEVLRIHKGLQKEESLSAAVELLDRVQIERPKERASAYPHQLSGGQRQRVTIAMAIACSPDLLIADEPTTALDVTVQAGILHLLNQLVDEEGASLLLITHDLPVVAAVCRDVMVMYGGKIVETGVTKRVFGSPRHPYTGGLVDAIPKTIPRQSSRRLVSIPGSVPPLGQFPSGCVFRNRCARETEICATEPALEGNGTAAACWHPLDKEFTR